MQIIPFFSQYYTLFSPFLIRKANMAVKHITIPAQFKVWLKDHLNPKMLTCHIFKDLRVRLSTQRLAAYGSYCAGQKQSPQKSSCSPTSFIRFSLCPYTVPLNPFLLLKSVMLQFDCLSQGDKHRHYTTVIQLLHMQNASTTPPSSPPRKIWCKGTISIRLTNPKQ